METTTFITTKAQSLALKNEDKTQAELDAVQARARTRTISHADLVRAAKEAEARLEAMAVPVRERAGAEATYDPHVLPNAYRDRGETTVAVLRRNTQGWTLVQVDRRPARKASYGSAKTLWVRLEQTEAQRAEALKRLEARHGVEFTAPKSDA